MTQFVDKAVDIKVRLAALWAATMACYIYCDYFELYVPGKLESMLAGTMGPLGAVTQGALYSALLAMLAVTAGWYFYKLFATVEAVLTLAIVANAWRWPREADRQQSSAAG